jgi:F-type H+-transporting ATPase subunit alpha
MKKVAGKLKIELSQFRELEAFAQFGSDLDADTQATLARGQRLVEMLNQNELKPWKVEDEVAAVLAGTAGYLDRIKTDRVQDFLEAMLQRLHTEYEDLMNKIRDGEWSDEFDQKLSEAIAEAVDDFGPDFDEEGNPLEEGESERVKKRDSGASASDEGSDDSEDSSEDSEREEAGATA